MVKAKILQLIELLWSWQGDSALEEIILYCQQLKGGQYDHK